MVKAEALKKKVRDEIVFFALEMEDLMAENDKSKGESWKGIRVKKLLDHLDFEFDELKFEIEEMDIEQVQKILTDMANYCMMSWNKLEERKNDEEV